MEAHATPGDGASKDPSKGRPARHVKGQKKEGFAIDSRKLQQWVDQFATYHLASISATVIENWIKQFDPPDRALACRVLDSIQYFSPQQVISHFKGLPDKLAGWDRNPNKRKGGWYFAPFAKSSGESAGAMIHQFRLANNMSQKQFDDLFVHKSELARAKAEDTVVLIDDFSGTGGQICEGWRDQFEEILANGPDIYVLLVATTETAIQKIKNETEMMPFGCVVMDDSANVFHDKCKRFNADEKVALEKYCLRASKSKPRGFGDLGLTIVFSHRCPNNSIAVLHNASQRWVPIFRRFV